MIVVFICFHKTFCFCKCYVSGVLASVLWHFASVYRVVYFFFPVPSALPFRLSVLRYTRFLLHVLHKNANKFFTWYGLQWVLVVWISGVRISDFCELRVENITQTWQHAQIAVHLFWLKATITLKLHSFGWSLRGNKMTTIRGELTQLFSGRFARKLDKATQWICPAVLDRPSFAALLQFSIFWYIFW